MKECWPFTILLCVAAIACADPASRGLLQTISVQGEVRSPGTYAVTNNMTIRDALLAAGGPTEYGVRLIAMRGTNTFLQCYTTEVIGHHSKTNVVIRNGDVIFVQHQE